METLNADEVLEDISLNEVKLRRDQTREYTHHFREALKILINKMKQNDKLFGAIFKHTFFMGSVYDGLKIDEPNEYDVCLVMKLSINYKNIKIINRRTKFSFIKIMTKELKRLNFHPRTGYPAYKPMKSWTDNNGFLLQTKFRAWVMSVVDKALNALSKTSGYSNARYTITRTISGPAITLHIKVNNIPSPIELDVDLVPVIKFDTNMWPPRPFRKNPFPDIDDFSFFAVPKPSSKIVAEANDTFWRLAFPEQEREMIEDKNLLKPVARLLKQLRNVQNLSIPSYYIKTMCLWDVKDRPDDYWSKTSLSTLFMDMLWELRYHMFRGGLCNYWDRREHLLDDINRKDIAGRLNTIFKDIDRNMENNPEVFYKYLQYEDEDESEVEYESDDDSENETEYDSDEYEYEHGDEDDDDDDDEDEDESDDDSENETECDSDDDDESDDDVYW